MIARWAGFHTHDTSPHRPSLVPSSRYSASTTLSLSPLSAKTTVVTKLALFFCEQCHMVDQDGWMRIDAAEKAAGHAIGKPREKVVTLSRALELAAAHQPGKKAA